VPTDNGFFDSVRELAQQTNITHQRVMDMALIVTNSICYPGLHPYDVQDFTYDEYLHFREVLDELLGSIFTDIEPTAEWMRQLELIVTEHFSQYET
jgi:hypothetical protein